MTTRCPLIVRFGAAASLLVVASLALTGCSSANKTAKKPMASKAPVAMAAVEEPRQESDDYTALTRGQTFTVRLPTYCGSQRGWRIDPKSAEDRFVKMLDRKSQQVHPGASSTLDARAWDEFTFRATKSGETNLVFILDQPWHPEQQAVRTHVLTCNITPPTKGQGKLHQASVTVD